MVVMDKEKHTYADVRKIHDGGYGVVDVFKKGKRVLTPKVNIGKNSKKFIRIKKMQMIIW